MRGAEADLILQLQSSHSAMLCGFLAFLGQLVDQICCCCRIGPQIQSETRTRYIAQQDRDITSSGSRDEKEDDPGQGHTWSVMTALYCGFMQGVENRPVTHCASEYSFAAAHR